MKMLNKLPQASTIFCFLLAIHFTAFAQEDKEIVNTIYFTSNTGNVNPHLSSPILKAITQDAQGAKKPVFVALGNITRKHGFPPEDKKREEEKSFLKNSLMEPLKGFKGRIIYTPGKNEWNRHGHENIDDLESYLQDNSKAEFWPNDGCPIERESLSDQVELVMVDSQWYLENWDNHIYINNKCEIKTREQFFAQFKDELKDEQNKTIIVAIHHPVLSAQRKGFLGRMGGFSKQYYYSKPMQELVGRLETLASQFEDVIFVSGNHTNLQYLSDDGIPQVIAGSLKPGKKTRPDTKEGHFGSSKPGFAKLIAFANGDTQVSLYEVNKDGNQLVFSHLIPSKRKTLEEVTYHPISKFGKTYKASIYSKEEVNKSNFYVWAWGEHYRSIYGREIEAPVLNLEALPHNVRALRAGGGNQSRTLRLIDDNENEYNIRELKKSAVRFIQSSIPDHYVKNYMKNTIAEEIVQDYYTTAHPYAPFAVGQLLDAIDIYHANPKIVYVPKQKRLGRFNASYGDKLYMFEEHVGDENKDFKTFGKADDILSTADMLLELRDNKRAKIDEETYIRARLFDMLVGDWDRHADQWRWAKFEIKDSLEIYKAIPRDRDQAFPKYDGPIISLLKLGIPNLRVMQSYTPKPKNLKWLNHAGYHLDQAFINRATWQDWANQVSYIQKNLSDAKINKAFADLLPDVQDESIEQIKHTLKKRRDNLLAIAKEYYTYFKMHEVIIATHKDNEVFIKRLPNGETQIQILDEGVEILNTTYNKKETKEIWLYTLDGDDHIHISGNGDNLIKLKIFGGEERDTYDFENKKRTKIYDYKSKENNFKNVGSKRLTNSYAINNYDPKKKIYDSNVVLPRLGYNRDAGFRAGITNVYTRYDLLRNPFSSQHTLSIDYYGATQGLEFNYDAEFAHLFYNWNLGIDARITGNNFATNYFGMGNSSAYDVDDVTLDYNRVNMKQWHLAPSLIYTKGNALRASIKAIIEANEVSFNDNRFTGDNFNKNNPIFENQIYAGGELAINYNNKGSLIGYPRRGMELGLTAGYKSSVNGDFDNKFAYLNPLLSFVYPIHESGAATLATKAEANFILGDNYNFYHAATVGGDTSLRGFRNQRFTGKTGFYQTTDLRVGLTKFKTNFIPLRVGVSAGFDYGRVWLENDSSNKWHTSYGGSIFINGFNALTANLGYYMSDEDNRFLFSLGFRF